MNVLERLSFPKIKTKSNPVIEKTLTITSYKNKYERKKLEDTNDVAIKRKA